MLVVIHIPVDISLLWAVTRPFFFLPFYYIFKTYSVCLMGLEKY